MVLRESQEVILAELASLGVHLTHPGLIAVKVVDELPDQALMNKALNLELPTLRLPKTKPEKVRHTEMATKVTVVTMADAAVADAGPGEDTDEATMVPLPSVAQADLI